MYSSNCAHENSANNDTLHIRSSDRKKKKISVFICKAQVEYKSSGIGHSPIIELILSNDGQTKLVNLNIRKLDASNKNEKRLTVVIYWILISFGTRFYVWENQCTVEIVEQKHLLTITLISEYLKITLISTRARSYGVPSENRVYTSVIVVIHKRTVTIPKYWDTFSKRKEEAIL